MNTEKSIFSFKENALSDKKMSLILGGRIDPPPPPPVLDPTPAAQNPSNGLPHDYVDPHPPIMTSEIP